MERSAEEMSWGWDMGVGMGLVRGKREESSATRDEEAATMVSEMRSGSLCQPLQPVFEDCYGFKVVAESSTSSAASLNAPPVKT